MIGARTVHPVRIAAQSPRALPAGRPARAARTVVAQAAPSAAPTAGKAASVPVTFAVSKQVHFGQQVVLVGSHERLGAWCLDAGARMAWAEGDVWSACVELPLGAALEYKFAVVDPTHPPKWETRFNRKLTVGASAAVLSGSWEDDFAPVGVAVNYDADDEEEKVKAAAAGTMPAAPAQQRATAPAAKGEVRLPAAAEAVVGGLIEQAESAAAAVAQLVAEELVGAAKKQSIKRAAKPAPAPAPTVAAALAAAEPAAAVAEPALKALPEQPGSSSKRRGASKPQTKRGAAAKAKAADGAAQAPPSNGGAGASASGPASKYSPQQLDFMRRNGKL